MEAQNNIEAMMLLSLNIDLKPWNAKLFHWQIRGGARDAYPPVRFLLFSCSFWQKSCQIIVFLLKLRGWRPLWEILDLPLYLAIVFNNNQFCFRSVLLDKCKCLFGLEQDGPDFIVLMPDILTSFVFVLVAPQDVVVLLDRSRSIGFYTMEEDGKNFMVMMQDVLTGFVFVLVAPQDVVVLLDRSRSIGFYTMEEDGKNFMVMMQDVLTGFVFVLVAPQDVVVLLDRSRSIGFYTMEEDGKEFMETMLRTGYIIHPNYTRLAVITYAGSVTTVFDSITGKGLTGCELFAKNGE